MSTHKYKFLLKDVSLQFFYIYLISLLKKTLKKTIFTPHFYAILFDQKSVLSYLSTNLISKIIENYNIINYLFLLNFRRHGFGFLSYENITYQGNYHSLVPKSDNQVYKNMYIYEIQRNLFRRSHRTF